MWSETLICTLIYATTTILADVLFCSCSKLYYYSEKEQFNQRVKGLKVNNFHLFSFKIHFIIEV